MILSQVYDFFMKDDVQNKFLIKNVYATPAIVFMYVLFVKWIGPWLMTNRKPYNLKKVLIVYNFTQSAINAFVAYKLVMFAIEIWPDHCLIKYSPNMPRYVKLTMRTIWWLNLTKFGDLLDTIFFVLRKKYNQISFLHVFHHGLMCLIFTTILRVSQFGYFLVVILVTNTTIHIIMYTYYGLAAFGRHMQKYLWWKKYLTTMQIIQFIIQLCFMLVGFIRGCEELRWPEISIFIFIVILLALFLNFYFKNYKKDA